MPRDHEARTAEIGEPDDIPLTTKQKARYTVAGNSLNAQDCEEIWRMLGIHPDQDGDKEGLL